MKPFEMVQLQTLSLRVMRSHAEIVSGAYKLRKTQKIDMDSGLYVEISDEEKLQSAFRVMDAHIRLAEQITDRVIGREHPSEDED